MKKAANCQKEMLFKEQKISHYLETLTVFS